MVRGQNDIEAISLQSSQAEEVIGLLESMSLTGAAKDVKGRRVRIVADNRTNRIIIKGDTATRKRIRQMIEMYGCACGRSFGWFEGFSLEICQCTEFSRNIARSGFRTGGEQQL